MAIARQGLKLSMSECEVPCNALADPVPLRDLDDLRWSCTQAT